MSFLDIFLTADLAKFQPDDYVGFTFFTGYMAMLAASIFFFFESGVEFLTSGNYLYWFRLLITWYRCRALLLHAEIFTLLQVRPLRAATSRYIDWTLTVPLMCVEFYLIDESSWC